MIEFAAVVIGSYLLGAIPFGLVLGKLRGVDVRAYGSGKIGSANVLRTLGTRAAVLVFVADLLKGVIVVLIARFILESHVGEMAAGFAAIAGHDWSVFLKFKGGRGVVTSMGGLLAMAPLIAVAGLAIFILIVALSRYVSLGSMVGALSAVAMMAALMALDRVPLEHLIYTAIAVALIIFQHWDNIARLLSGSERKLGQREERRQI